jgi:hypothetical protein
MQMRMLNHCLESFHQFHLLVDAERVWTDRNQLAKFLDGTHAQLVLKFIYSPDAFASIGSNIIRAPFIILTRSNHGSQSQQEKESQGEGGKVWARLVERLPSEMVLLGGAVLHHGANNQSYRKQQTYIPKV